MPVSRCARLAGYGARLVCLVQLCILLYSEYCLQTANLLLISPIPEESL